MDVEFLNDKITEVGARIRETRLVNGKEVTEDFEITEYVENDHVRIVNDSHGTVWDSVFQVTTESGQTILTLTMDARPHKLVSRITVPLLKGVIANAIGKDLDLVKEWCEREK